MELIKSLTTEDKLDILAESAKYDVCLASCNGNTQGGIGRKRSASDPTRWIYPVSVPGRGQVHMLKVLYSNICVNHCSYCAFRSSETNIRRASFTPHELAGLFMDFYRRRLVHGLFLSSGICGNANDTMEGMIRTVELLRIRDRFTGYIHLKILPGTEASLVEQAVRLANRISLNLESPTPNALKTIAPDKDFKESLLKRMKWTGDLIKNKSGRAVSQTTQFVVGAAKESDRDILKTVDWVYREMYMFRSYFSSFQSEEINNNYREREDGLKREHRLYQSDFLLRAYGFRMKDIVFNKDGRIPTEVDPKYASAILHPEHFPVDINTGASGQLLRVPGIGPISVDKILKERKETPFRGNSDLKKLGVLVAKAASFIEFSGKKSASEPDQPLLFDSDIPKDWRDNETPLQSEKITAPDYIYPAQQGKNVNYIFSKKTKPVPCRDPSL